MIWKHSSFGKLLVENLEKKVLRNGVDEKI
jgi:hypothetical protein